MAPPARKAAGVDVLMHVDVPADAHDTVTAARPRGGPDGWSAVEAMECLVDRERMPDQCL
jgi:hypothetical protein